jgi:hypothetical protein
MAESYISRVESESDIDGPSFAESYDIAPSELTT